jgi:capsular polysaccharide transport system permease protein
LLSGVIIPLQSLPQKYLQWLLWNPLLHLIDLSRTFFLPNYQPLAGANAWYPAACALVAVVLGASMYRVYRHQLIASG